MTQTSDGMTYAPKGKPAPVVKPGEFGFAAMHLDHGHIFGQTNGLLEAGAELRWVYDPDPAKVAHFVKTYPQAKVARSRDEVYADPAVKLVASAAVPNERGPLGCEVMERGRDYFTDKTPFTTLAQLAQAKQVCAKTGKKYAVYYSERLHVESAMYAGELIHDHGAIGRVVQVLGLGPHRLNKPSRPAWFFKKEQYGGILCDIGSHQVEQFLHFTGNTEAFVQAAKVGNYNNPDTPELEDFGDMTVVGGNGATGYHRVDWLTPDGLSTWGDGRMLIIGTEGYIELRKYCDPCSGTKARDLVLLVDKKGEHRIEINGKVGFSYFGKLVRDCIERSETAMTQTHAFKAAELCLTAQAMAVRVTG